MKITTVLCFLTSTSYVCGHGINHKHDQTSLSHAAATPDHISPDVHAHWMRVAIQALFDLVSPCPFGAYGTAIVNHTSQHGLGELICIGANAVSQTGNPTLHGEIAAIDNCTAVLVDPNGPYRLTPAEASAAYADFTLYTTAEACAMCATAIRWAGFKGYVYATSIDRLVDFGWQQPTIPSKEVFERSTAVGPATYLVPDVLANETDPLLWWQFNSDRPCPKGCSRQGEDESCQAD